MSNTFFIPKVSWFIFIIDFSASSNKGINIKRKITSIMDSQPWGMYFDNQWIQLKTFHNWQSSKNFILLNNAKFYRNIRNWKLKIAKYWQSILEIIPLETLGGAGSFKKRKRKWVEIFVILHLKKATKINFSS